MRTAAARMAIAPVAAVLLAFGCASRDAERVEEPAPPTSVAEVRAHGVRDLLVPRLDPISAVRGNCVLYHVPPPDIARRRAESAEDRARLLRALREECSVPEGDAWIREGDFLVVRGDPALQESVASWIGRRRSAD